VALGISTLGGSTQESKHGRLTLTTRSRQPLDYMFE
jgi:hypothetical protein